MTPELIPGKLYNINTISASYKQSDDIEIYDVKNLKSLVANTKLMFIGETNIKYYTTKTSNNQRLKEEIATLTFTDGKEKYFLFKDSGNFCSLIS